MSTLTYFKNRFYHKPLNDTTISKKLSSNYIPKKIKKKLDYVLSIKNRTETKRVVSPEAINVCYLIYIIVHLPYIGEIQERTPDYKVCRCTRFEKYCGLYRIASAL